MSDPSTATDDDLPEIECTLTAEQAKARRAWVTENLLPVLEAVEEREDGYSLVFERTLEAYRAVTEAAWKESQCCSWATFEVELPPGDEPFVWHERSEREDGTVFFGDALRDILDDEEAPTME